MMKIHVTENTMKFNKGVGKMSRILATVSAVVVMENWFDRFPVSRFSSATHSLSWYYVRKRRRILHSIPFKLLGLSSSYDQVVARLDDDTESPHDVICVIGSKG